MVLKKVLAIVGLTAGGWLGWVIGSRANPFAGYFMAVLCSAFGLYVTMRWASRYY
jgi:hypothetical protein